jgi:Acyl carrier protein
LKDLLGGIEMNLEKYNTCFKEIFGDDARLDEDFKFGVAQGWDSMAHMELIALLEDTFDIMFETEDILHYGSYENGKTIIKKYGVEI